MFLTFLKAAAEAGEAMTDIGRSHNISHSTGCRPAPMGQSMIAKRRSLSERRMSTNGGYL